jgi:hypothetical protein
MSNLMKNQMIDVISLIEKLIGSKLRPFVYCDEWYVDISWYDHIWSIGYMLGKFQVLDKLKMSDFKEYDSIEALEEDFVSVSKGKLVDHLLVMANGSRFHSGF